MSAGDPPSTEEMLTSPDWFGLVDASPLQRAICRWADGMPVDHVALDAWLRETGSQYADDIRERMTLSWVLGGDGVRVTRRPVELLILAGIRTGKTKIAEVIQLQRSQTVDMGDLDPGEYVLSHHVSLKLQLARVAIMHLHAAARRPGVQSIMVGDTDPERLPTDGLVVAHPSGRVVRLQVSHGGRAGGGLVATWVSCVTFDEAGRMVGEDDGVVNLDHARSAVIHRLLDGGQVIYPTSPWAPIGPVYDMVREHHGKPGDVLVVRAPAPALWPARWTPERCEAARERSMRKGDDSYTMDILGEWGTPETAMFGDAELAEVMRDGELEPVDGEHYIATMDPAGQGGNAWTLVIGGIRRSTGRPTVVYAGQWYPTAEFPESEVLRAIKPVLERYRVGHAYTDQYAAGFVISLAREVGITMCKIQQRAWTRANKVDAFDSLRVMVRERAVELCAAPSVREDLLRVRRKLTQGGVSIHFPPTADGRHCDYAPAIAMWATSPMDEPDALREESTLMAALVAQEEAAEAAEDEPELTGWRQRRAARARG